MSNPSDPTIPMVITPRVIVAVPTLPPIGLVPARWYRHGPRRSKVIWIVLHCTAGTEGKRKAEDCAQMLASLPDDGKKRSTHLVYDTDSVVQCVPFDSEAWHCGANGNMLGEGHELCGSSEQTREQWLDALSLPMLALAARVVRWRCDALDIPVTARGPTDLRAHTPGITTHADISRAFPQDTDHHDPGSGFPLTEFLEAVRAA